MTDPSLNDPVEGRAGGRQTWQLLRAEYIAERAAAYRITLERERARVAAELEGTRPGSGRYRKLEGESVVVEQHCQQFAVGVPDWYLQRETRRYDRIIVLALQRGLEVPEAVVAQAQEYRAAADAHARYEKGYATSYGNATGRLDRSRQAAGGYKMKAQDGRALTPDQVAEITGGVEAVEGVVGSLAEILSACDATISHTRGKHPFLKAAGGLYHTGERVVTVGVLDRAGRPILALGHELLGHLVDDAAGRALGVEVAIWKSKRGSRVSLLAEHDYRNMTGGYELLYDARQAIHLGLEARQAVRVTGYEGLAPARAAFIERLRVMLSAYWREPREIWARLVEQWLAARVRHPSLAVEADYTTVPGYWSAADWPRLDERVGAEIARRLDLARGAHQNREEGT
jgi:hypothetical protein